MLSLNGKVAIITGGGRGLGEAACLLFARMGAKVVVADMNMESAQKVVDAIQKQNGEAITCALNTSSYESAQQMVETVLAKYGQIDILVNNAGITRDAMMHKMTVQQWQQVIDTNLTGVFNCTHAVVNHMRERGYGRIINTSSIVGLNGNIGQANYAAAKAGLIGFTQTLAKELGPKGVNVNAVAPGYIKTPMTDDVPEKILKIMENSVPLKRLGQPEEVANTYLFLASDMSSYINGATISVDGGLEI